MTREEALKLLADARYADDLQGNNDLQTAHIMAMKALETEQQILDAVSKYNGSFSYLIDGKMILSKEVFIG